LMRLSSDYNRSRTFAKTTTKHGYCIYAGEDNSVVWDLARHPKRSNFTSSNARCSRFDLAKRCVEGLSSWCRAPSVLAGGLTEPVPGPSEYSMDEIEALTAFANNNLASLPHLITWKTAVQGAAGLMPNGYIFYNVMTLQPGQNLMDYKFWSLSEQERKVIRAEFIPVIKEVWKLGFEPYDCALRNIIWEPESQKLYTSATDEVSYALLTRV